MSSCACSSRALEVFIKDFAGLNVRRPAPRVPRRNLSTRPHLREPETIAVGAGVEDGFVPFDFENLRRHGVGKTKAGTEEIQLNRLEGNDATDEQEWHAEIVIAESWPNRTSGVDTTQLEQGGKVAEQAQTSVQEAKPLAREQHMVDGVALHNLHPATTSRDLSMIASVPLLAMPVAASKARVAEPTAGASRLENRRARRQRRTLAGTWAPNKVEPQKTEVLKREQEQEDDVASVLQKIEGLEGPSVGGRKGKEGKERKARKAADTSLLEQAGRRAKTKNARTTGLDQIGKRVKEYEEGRKRKTDTKSTRLDRKAGAKPTVDPTKSKPKPQEVWQVQKAALAAKFGAAGWQPSKKVSPDTMSGIRALHASDPTAYTTATLSRHFEMSPEAVRRILRSKWQPTEEQTEARRLRWEQRGVKKWDDMAAKGMRPPKKWREMGVEWGRKSNSRTARSTGVGMGRVRERLAEAEGVGMLSGIEEGIEERIV